ncbi:MAG: N-acetyltransferase [Moraxellaceae bacterium]|nr:MAG: N-acetyltransferase [Moraxellaceae bacterium]
MENVEHLPQQNRFVLKCDGAEAVLQYHLTKPAGSGSVKAIDFSSTYVPPAFRGKGLAEQLVRAGIKWAKDEGYELHASCWYVAKFLR